MTTRNLRHLAASMAIACCMAACPLNAEAQMPTTAESEIMKLADKAQSLFKNKDYDQALLLYRQCKEKASALQTPSAKDIRHIMTTKMVLCYGHLKQPLHKVELLDSLLADAPSESIRQFIMQEYAHDCLAAAKEANMKSQFTEARTLLKKGMPFTDHDVKLRKLLNRYWGLTYYKEGVELFSELRFTEAKAAADSSLIYYAHSATPDDSVTSLMLLAFISEQEEQNDLCINHFDQALEVAEKNNLEKRVLMIWDYKKKLFQVLNRPDEELRANLAINAISQTSTNPEVRLMALKICCDDAFRAKQWRRAEQLYRKLFATYKQMGDNRQKVQMIEIMLKLEAAASNQGAYRRAMDYLNEYERMSTSRRTIFSHKSLLYAHLGIADSAIAMTDSLFALHQADKNPEKWAYDYLNRASVMNLLKRTENVVADCRSALGYLLQDTDKKNVSTTVACKMLLSANCLKLGENEEALSLIRECVEQQLKSHGENSAEYLEALYRLAHTEAFCGKIEEGVAHLTKTVALLRHMLEQNLRTVTNEQREAYISQFSHINTSVAAFARKAYGRETANALTTTGYNALLLLKGLLLASEQSAYSLIKRHGKSDDLRIYTQLESNRSQLRALEAAKVRDDKAIADTYQRVTRLDAQLIKRCAAYGNIGEFIHTGYNDVRAALQDGEVLVDMVDFMDDKGIHQYMAYIVRPNEEHPLLMTVCKGEMIDSLLKEEDNIPARLCEGTSANELTRRVLAPLLSKLHRGERVYWIPSGIFHQLPIEALPLEASPEGDSPRLADAYEWVRLTTARKLCEKRPTWPSHPSAVLYGGLDYDMTTEEMTEQSRQYDLTILENEERKIGQTFRKLPYSLEEVIEAGKELRAKHLPADSIVIRKEKEGTEESFFALNGKAPSILHLATHGFYYAPTATDKALGLQGYTDAMNLSGLAMSGGNAGWMGKRMPGRAMDGLLTADDIARTDLSAARLVLLSACHSGSGQATPEGVYGLQRAFKKAGADVLVMSLWQANDLAAACFMRTFYKQLQFDKKEWNVRQAFDAARQAVRNDFPEPYYWAGFILVE